MRTDSTAREGRTHVSYIFLFVFSGAQAHLAIGRGTTYVTVEIAEVLQVRILQSGLGLAEEKAWETPAA